jgi:hypothetical protein
MKEFVIILIKFVIMFFVSYWIIGYIASLFNASQTRRQLRDSKPSVKTTFPNGQSVNLCGNVNSIIPSYWPYGNKQYSSIVTEVGSTREIKGAMRIGRSLDVIFYIAGLKPGMSYGLNISNLDSSGNPTGNYVNVIVTSNSQGICFLSDIPFPTLVLQNCDIQFGIGDNIGDTNSYIGTNDITCDNLPQYPKIVGGILSNDDRKRFDKNISFKIARNINVKAVNGNLIKV